jgi:hypothetical protein
MEPSFSRLKFIAFLVIVFSIIILPDIRFVSKTGSAKPPYISWETAADSIQKCIYFCNKGDTIYVANGTYTEMITMNPGLTLVGMGQDSCIIDDRKIANGNFNAISVKDSCTISGFKIMVSEGLQGTVFNCVGKKIIIKNNNISKTYHGIFADSCELEIYNNYFSYCEYVLHLSEGKVLFHSNNCIKIKSNVIFIINGSINKDSYIFNNVMDLRGTECDGIQSALGTKPTIYNNIILMDNRYSSGVALGGGDTVRFFNNLLFATYSDGMYDGRGKPNYIYNNVFYGPTAWPCLIIENNSHLIVNNIFINGTNPIWQRTDAPNRIQYNNFFNNSANSIGVTPDSTNLEVDPMFVNDTSDFHLQMFSPLIDKGDPDIIDLDATRSDVGLYGGPFGERSEYRDLPPKAPRGLTLSKDSNYVTIKWNRNTETDFNQYNLFRDTVWNFIVGDKTFISSLKDTSYKHIIQQGVTIYYYKLTATDNQGNISKESEELGINVTSVNDKPQLLSNFQLFQNYPNPFNPSTIIPYRLKERGFVKLTIFNIMGEQIAVLVNQAQEAGYYEVDFRGKNSTKGKTVVDRIASGIYFYRLEVIGGNNIPLFNDLRKMVLLK